MEKEKFDIIILIGRPAAGKSEVIDYLKKTPEQERLRRFHIGKLDEIDDFVYVWDTFENDDILSKLGKERIFTDKKYYFKDNFIWNFYIEKINLAYKKKLVENPNYHKDKTVLIEFARGGENGFREAFSYLDEEILKKAGILYIKVSYEESVRRNRKRQRKNLEHSILFHSLPDDKMEFYYKINDWDKLTGDDPDLIFFKNLKIPYVEFVNEPEKTDDPVKIGNHLEEILGRLGKRLS
jgi:tRNA uridine 5-carbamoylmethylation protein Kti12